MARPKKTAGASGARERICQTFWEMLETQRLKDITVGALTAAGSCNRGTFYYHFNSIDDLIYHVIEDELLAKDGFVMARLFQMSTGNGVGTGSDARLRRMILIVKRGGYDLVFEKVYSVMATLWRSVCCLEGGELSEDVLAMLQFSVGGMLSVLAHQPLSESGDLVISEECRELMSSCADFFMGKIGELHDISREELVSRVTTLSTYLAR